MALPASKYFNHVWLVYACFAFFFLDILSLAAYTFPRLNLLLLPLLSVAIIVICVRDKNFLFYIPFAEAIWGSFGRELSWTINGFSISLRMLIFAICILVWLIQARSQLALELRSALSPSFLGLFVVFIWGVLVSIIRGNQLSFLYTDSNAYLFILYFPIWFSVFKIANLDKLFAIFFGACIEVAAKTLVLFHLFIHNYSWFNAPYVYLWLRDDRFGEITYAGNSLWRIFLQSQIFIGVALIIMIVYLFTRRKSTKSLALFSIVGLFFAAIIASLSRSFWLGLVATLFILTLFSSRYLIHRLRASLSTVLHLIASFCVSLLVLMFLIQWSFGGLQLSDVFLSRVSGASSDAAGISRVNQLPALAAKISEHLFLGSGFGATVTYFSSDPRLKNAPNPTGRTTTSSFEWGYLDQLLKFGLIFFGLLCGVLVAQFAMGWNVLRQKPYSRLPIIALLSGLLFIMIVHTVSPYLNHPLGLAYLMVVIIVIQQINRTHHEETHD